MTNEYAGAGNAFVIRYPEDWTCSREEPRSGELDRLILHKSTGGLGAVRISFVGLKGEPDTAEKFLARARELYAGLVAGETKVVEWIRGKMGGKTVLIRVSLGMERGTPIMTTLYIAASSHTAMLASYTIPLNRPKAPEDKVETAAVVQLVTSATLS